MVCFTGTSKFNIPYQSIKEWQTTARVRQLTIPSNSCIAGTSAKEIHKSQYISRALISVHDRNAGAFLIIHSGPIVYLNEKASAKIITIASDTMFSSYELYVAHGLDFTTKPRAKFIIQCREARAIIVYINIIQALNILKMMIWQPWSHEFAVCKTL